MVHGSNHFLPEIINFIVFPSGTELKAETEINAETGINVEAV
jgi:hypothetical protein